VNQKEKKLKPAALCIYGFLQVTVTLTAGVGRQRGRRHSRPPGFFWSFQLRRVNPRAASGGGAWEDASPLFMLSRRASQHCYGFLRGYFVIFKLINVIFV
jgi:hypothetical protein